MCEHQQVLPDGLPLKLGNVQSKRQRTVTINKLKSSKDVSTLVQDSHTCTRSTTTLTLNNFLMTASQISERKVLDSNLFSYILQKFTLHHQPGVGPANTTLSEFRSFLDEKKQSMFTTTITNILYGANK